MIIQHIAQIMNKKEIKRQESRNPRAIWKEYKSRIKKHENDNFIYCFFEGDDDPKYYNSRIESITKKEISYFICNGKIGVINTIKAFELKKEEHILAFFIDNDFDNLLKIYHKYDKLYVTPCYSIENFYIDVEVFKKILKIEFKINEENKNYEKYIEIYKNRQKEFHEIILEINSLIVLYHYLKMNKNYNENIVYQNIKLDHIVKISLENIKKKDKKLNLFDDIKSMIKLDTKIKEKYEEFKSKLNKNPKYNFRGKFEIQFLNKMLILLATEIKTSFKTDEKNIVSNLSHYAQTDDSLEIFLSLIYFF